MDSSSDDTYDTKSSDNSSKYSVIEVINTTLELGGKDKRFGFSIIGGLDEGLCPSIEDIAEGNQIYRVRP